MGEMRYVPLKDGKQEVCLGHEYIRVSANGAVLDIRHRDSEDHREFEASYPITLYSDIRLCQAVPAEPVLPMPSAEVVKTLRDACVQRKHDIWMAHGCSTDEIQKAEKIVARYDAALAWLEGLQREGNDAQ